jgi:type I restriction enzyme S subunit
MSWGGGNILALSANNVHMGHIDTSREAYYGSERLYQTWMTHGPTRRGDVLITLEAPLGNVARIPDDKKYILSQRVVLLRFAETRMLNEFAYWYMQSEVFQRALVLNSTGTTATGIRRERLERIIVPIPSIPEQRRIALFASAIQAKVDTELAVEAKLKRIQQGLTNDLLTGHIRVGVPT